MARVGLRASVSPRLEAGGALVGLIDAGEHYRVLGVVAQGRFALWRTAAFSTGRGLALGAGYDADILHADLDADGLVAPYGSVTLDADTDEDGFASRGCAEGFDLLGHVGAVRRAFEDGRAPRTDPLSMEGFGIRVPPEMARAKRSRSEVEAADRPTLTLYARAGDHEIALCRWPTTIGGWKTFEKSDGTMVKYKASVTGNALWPEILAAPSWHPAPGMPTRKLLVKRGDTWDRIRRSSVPVIARLLGWWPSCTTRSWR